MHRNSPLNRDALQVGEVRPGMVRMRAEGNNPSGTPAAIAKLQATQRKRAVARTEWELSHPEEQHSAEEFGREPITNYPSAVGSAVKPPLTPRSPQDKLQAA